jgi:hypothetical protein
MSEIMVNDVEVYNNGNKGKYPYKYSSVFVRVHVIVVHGIVV